MAAIKVLLVFLITFLTGFADAASTRVKLAYIGNINHDAYLGVKQGLIEANLQGQFLGVEYSLEVLDGDKISEADLSDFVALLANLDDAALIKLSTLAADSPVFDLVSESDSLRKNCVRNVLHVMPSAMMKQAAVVAGKEKYQRDLEAKAWHYDFNKFAARDLNKRFKKNFKHNMTEHAWAGWAAVKMTTDSVARTSATQAAELLQYLKHKLSFDGQKGLAMNFDNKGQLSQILLLTAEGELIGEAPLEDISGSGVSDDIDCTKQIMQ